MRAARVFPFLANPGMFSRGSCPPAAAVVSQWVPRGNPKPSPVTLQSGFSGLIPERRHTGSLQIRDRSGSLPTRLPAYPPWQNALKFLGVILEAVLVSGAVMLPPCFLPCHSLAQPVIQ